MKKYFLFTIMFVAFAAGVFAQDQLVVDPNATIRELKSSFSKIKVSHGIDLYLSQSSTESLAVSASEEKYADKIITVVENGVLRISYDGSGWTGSGNRQLKAYVSFKDINELEASGSSDIRVAGSIKASKLSLRLSGSSDFIGSVMADDLVLDMSGSSDVKISGTANTLNLENSGASDLKGYDLVVNVCNSNSSGASDVNITVKKELNVQASGASDVYYKGNPVVKTLRSSGASTIANRD